MKEIKAESTPKITIHLRKDLYSLFSKDLKNFFDKSNCNYFSHTIIKNYRQKGHTISNFNSQEEWQELYWDKYKEEDLLEKACHSNALENTIGLSSWNIIDIDSECAQTRMSVCNVKDGLLFAISCPNQIIENVSIGWKNLTNTEFDLDKIFNLIEVMKPLRKYHRESSPFKF